MAIYSKLIILAQKQRFGENFALYIMNNSTYHLSLWVLLFFANSFKLQAQCTPAFAETCDESMVFCSLNELNGYTCSNLSTVPSSCSPLCSQGGTPSNTSWWGFVSQGGLQIITVSVGNCANSQGLRFGIWGDCSCGSEIFCKTNPCSPPGSVNAMDVELKPCKTYFLWIDGCNGDICDFTINTAGGNNPTLAPLGKINNVANMIIPVCEGACDFKLFVNPEPNACKPTYKWTIDGDLVGSNGSEINLDFPNAGDFVVCVTVYIGNPISGSICEQTGPQCATIKVKKIAEKYGIPRMICQEQAKGQGYKWYSKRVTSSGIYRQTFSENDCCKFDSIVEFIVRDVPASPDVYYITCDNEPYIDILGKSHAPCLDHQKILLPKTTMSMACDSSITLTAINVQIAPNWQILCNNGMVELIPNIRIIKPCSVGETYEFSYKWYKKAEPTKILSNDETLSVPGISEDYLLQVGLRVDLETESVICSKIFSENFNESNSFQECSFAVKSTKFYCFDTIASYWLDSLIVKSVNSYSWLINGGQIISNPDSPYVKVKWNLSANDTGKVCVSYNTDCGNSCQKCIDVIQQTQIAGADFEKRGLSAYLDARPGPNGRWRFISGPHKVIIQDSSYARTRISAYNYGKYCFEWMISDSHCSLTDTLCVDLHSFPSISPEYPKLIFFDRGQNATDYIRPQIELISNLISNDDECIILSNAGINSVMNYYWMDITGSIVFQSSIEIPEGIQRMNLSCPMQNGMYFLFYEINGQSGYKRICVMK